eukprot:GILI01001515.1.p1 GENE.GILI01001515.1~~GILI01001515.1.p1  ORF type:complete len:471 (-),score=146.77 GILI01001515.1:249-1457(-)
MQYFEGSLTAPLVALMNGELTFSQLYGLVPWPSKDAAYIYATFVAFQVLLYQFVPGKMCQGQVTPAGNKLWYNINGLACYLISVVAWFVCTTGLNLFPATIVYDNVGSLIATANVIGFSWSAMMYLQGRFFPTNSDQALRGRMLYDYVMGIDLNPRYGNFDIKLFTVGRIGMTAWGLINFSYAAKQVELHGSLTNSMALVLLLHSVYIVDFFWKEDWYLATIDIMHDHYGWYFGWGVTCWLEVTYCYQAWYLVTHPIVLSTLQCAAILGLCSLGYYIFRSSNDQKLSFRASKGQAKIWGRQPEFVVARYQTADGKGGESLLLASGFWGISRHFNYVGDLFMCLSYSLPCGFTHLLPYFYFFYMFALLAHRAHRDDRKCQMKYGEDWKKYCQKVPYHMIPYVY